MSDKLQVMVINVFFFNFWTLKFHKVV